LRRLAVLKEPAQALHRKKQQQALSQIGARSMPNRNPLAAAQRAIQTFATGTLLTGVLIAASLVPTSAAAESRQPRLHTNQQFLEDMALTDTLKINDALSVFGFVLESLPERVKVYPTENYYYFKFNYGGVNYSGNIRLENERRDLGQLHFAFAPEFTEWKSQDPAVFKILTEADGVSVEKVSAFSYRVTDGAKSVVFELNDLSHVVPPMDAMSADERFIGPIFDESGVRFLLVYNQKLKAFHYLLDETITPNETFNPSKSTDRILIGKRTGFAFYRDHNLNRKILIGVYEGNVRVNSYYDGPFDQLPDNFINGESLRDAVLGVAPYLKGRIDRFGGSFDGETRYMIAPYLQYATEDELLAFHRCAESKRVPAAQYPLCFVYDDSNSNVSAAVPRAQVSQRMQAKPMTRKAGLKANLKRHASVAH
jgi:hypothetical protein